MIQCKVRINGEPFEGRADLNRVRGRWEWKVEVDCTDHREVKKLFDKYGRAQVEIDLDFLGTWSLEMYLGESVYAWRSYVRLSSVGMIERVPGSSTEVISEQ